MLKKNIKKEEIVVMKTEKSGKFSIATRDMYREMGQQHISKDKVVTRAKMKEIDQIINKHCTVEHGAAAVGQGLATTRRTGNQQQDQQVQKHGQAVLSP